jgi:hypothetical protein
VRRPPRGRRLRGEHDPLPLGQVVFAARVQLAGLGAVCLHQLEDVVPPDSDLAVGGHDKLERLAVLVLNDLLVEADLLGVGHQVELGRRLRDRGDDGMLRKAELVELLPEVAERGGLDPVQVVAVEVVVQVGRDDGLLAFVAGELLGQPDRLDDLPELAVVRRPLERPIGQQPLANELLGDRGCATRPAGDRVEAGGDDAHRVEARVRPELLVLDGGRRVEHLVGDRVERDDLALQGAEAGQLDLPGAVVDDRRLVEIEIREDRLGVGQALGVLVVHADGEDSAHEAGREGEGHEDEGNGDGDAPDRSRATPSLGAPRDRSAMPLAPREACLHVSSAR